MAFTTTEQKILNAISLKRADNSAFMGDINARTLLDFLRRKNVLFAAGFLDFAPPGLEAGGTFLFDIPIFIVADTYADSTKGDAFQGETVTMHYNVADAYKTRYSQYDDYLYKNSKQLRGKVLAECLLRTSFLESLRFWKEYLKYIKDGNTGDGIDENGTKYKFLVWEKSDIEVDFPENDRSAKMAQKIEQMTDKIRFLQDKFTGGIPAELIKIFVTPKIFRKIKYGLAGQGHVIKELISKTEVNSEVLNGITVYEEPLMGVNHPLGRFHKKDAFDISKLEVAILVRKSLFAQMGQILIKETDIPETDKRGSLTKWMSGRKFPGMYLPRTAALVNADL